MSDQVLKYAQRRLLPSAFERFRGYYRGQMIFQSDYRVAELLDPVKALRMKKELVDAWEAIDLADDAPVRADDPVLQHLIKIEDKNIRTPDKLGKARKWQQLYEQVRPDMDTDEAAYKEVWKTLNDDRGLTEKPPSISNIKNTLYSLKKAEKAVKSS